MIRFGDDTIVNAYFEQVIRDDGCIDYRNYSISISMAQELGSKTAQEHLEMLKRPHWETKCLSGERIMRYLNLTKDLKDQLPDELKPVYDDFLSRMKEEWAPTILKEEKEVLERVYGVTINIYLKQVYLGEKTGLKGIWELIVRRKENFEKVRKQLDSVWKEGGDREHEP